ncbi:hypothetical protein K435DRAFT_671733, partial [Dendrothele bispora CBS 962.96]
MIAPIADVEDVIKRLWTRRKTDQEILNALLTRHIDTAKYGLGITRFRKMRKALGLLGTRQQGHTVDSISDAMVQLRCQYPKAGRHELHHLLFHEHGIRASRSIRAIEDWCHQWEPDLVRARRKHRLKRKRFWAAGVNDMWCVDQHDKWKRFGLALHTGMDPFSGKIKWLKVWWTNNNPRLIFRYYLECIKKDEYTYLITQSDPGSENFCLAKGHTFI